MNGPNKKYGIKESEYVEVCSRAGESFTSDVQKNEAADLGNLTSMKLSEKEREYPKGEMIGATASPKKPEFPWGLNVRLENEAMDKLSLNLADFKLNGEVFLIAKAYVREKDESTFESEGGGTRRNRSMSLQITHLKVIKEGGGAEA